MSLYRIIKFRCIIKQEYREFFKSVVMENNLEYASDEEIISDFMKELNYFCGYYEKLLNIVKIVDIEGITLPIYNEDTGECAMSFDYNRHNGLLRDIIYSFEHDLLPYISEGKIEYLYHWDELDDE